MLLTVVLFPQIGIAQSNNGKIQVEKLQIDIREPLVLKLEIEGAETKSISSFPEIPGFVKGKLNTISATSMVDGEEFSTTTYLQKYQALRVGKFLIPAFNLSINNEKYTFKATNIQVLTGTLSTNSENNETEELEDDTESFDEEISTKNPSRNSKMQEKNEELKEINEQTAKLLKSNKPFLQTKISKLSVFKGEAFQITINFLVPKNYKEEIQFHNLDAQLSEITNKIKPSGCWEENYPIDEVKERNIKIGGKQYLEYKLFQAYYFPYKVQKIKIPAVGLEMSILREGKEEGLFGVKIKEVFQKFYSLPYEIEVKSLPPHPLMNAVPVGEFRLREEISNTKVNTGSNINYFFTLIGSGYFKTIIEPQKLGKALDIFPTSVIEKINRTETNIKGSKEFRYQLMPLIPGDYSLEEYFQLIYFNTKFAIYDTLHSDITLHITGDSIASALQTSTLNAEEDFYKKSIPSASTQWVSTEGTGFNERREIYNYLLAALALLVLILLVFKRGV